MGAYGYSSWWRDGFSSQFRARREGGFGRDTEFSGIDKLGHVYFAYLGTRALAPAFELAGNAPDTSLKLSAWTVWGAMSAVEVLDGFSRNYRFSHEDFIANTIGVGMGYFLASNPKWDDVFDFRLAYRQTPLSNFDPPGDYAGQRYWLMVKADAIPRSATAGPALSRGRCRRRGAGRDTPAEGNSTLRAAQALGIPGVASPRPGGGLSYVAAARPPAQRPESVFEFVQHPGMVYWGRDLDRHIPPPPCCHPPPGQ